MQANSGRDQQTEDRRFPFTEGRVGKVAHAGTNPKINYTLYWDGETPGLGLRVTASGARSYVFEKRLKAGDTCRVTIGDPATWSLKRARAEARELAVLVDKGGDPRLAAKEKLAQDAARRVEEQRQDLVVRGVWAAYIEANKANWGTRHLDDHTALARPGGERKKRGKGLTKPGPLAALMPLKLSELTAECIESWLKRESVKRATNAAQSYRLLRAFIRWASDEAAYKGLIPADAYSAGKVRKAVPEANPKDGDCLQKEQLTAWFKGVRSLSNRIIRAYLQALLLTGVRREQLLSLVWDDVDFTWNTLILRTTAKKKNKGGNKRTMALTPYVASLLSALPRKNQWVFSSDDSESGRLMEPRIAHNAALEVAALPHVTLHGLRRTFGTLAEWVDPPGGVVLQIQGHKPQSVAEKSYRRRDLDFLRMWHEKIEAWFLEQAGVPFTKPGDKAKLGVVSADGTVQPAA
jgi:integrase